MTDSNTRPFGQSRIYKGLYTVTILFFAVFCAFRTSLLFTTNYTFLAASILFVVANGGIYFAPKILCRENKHARFALHTLAAGFFCTFSMTIYIPANKSLIWLMIYGFTTFFAGYALEKESEKCVRLSALLLGLLFALFVFIGSQLKTYGRLEILHIIRYDFVTSYGMLFTLFGQALLFSLVINTIFSEIVKRDFSSSEKDFAGWRKELLTIFLLTAGILVFYLPIYYFLYPGILTSDSVHEVEMQLGLKELTNHHPYIHQLVIKLALILGRSSTELGVGIYSFLQMFLLALTFAVCVYFLGRMGANKYIQAAAFCFYALFSVNGFYSVTMWKDVLFGAVSLGFMMLLVIQIREGKKGRLPLLIALGFFGFLFCVFRNNGWYAFLLGFPLFIICNRAYWKRLTAVFLAVVLLVCGYNHIIFNIMGIKKSATGEALSVPLQQIARTVNKNPSALKQDEVKDLREIFADPDALGDIYTPHISDPVKARDVFLVEVFDENPVKYLKAWAKLGIRCPVEYVEAFLMQCYGYWYPDVTYWIVTNNIYENDLGIDIIGERAENRMAFYYLTKELSESLPTAILYSLGLMVWLMMIAAVILILKGQGKYATPIFILAGLWLTTLASPVYCEYRYMYGFVTCVPLFLGLALGTKGKKQSGETSL